MSQGQWSVERMAVQFGRIVAGLGGHLEDADHVTELMHRLVGAACTSIDGADHCAVTFSVDGCAFTAATSSSNDTDAIDREQYDVGHGPCMHAVEHDETIVVDCRAGDDRWPEFGAAARAAGIAGLLCTPVRAGDQVIGSVSLYARIPHSFDGIDRDLLETLSDAFGNSLERYRRHRSLTATADGLRAAIEHRAPIEQAKGILMALRGIDEDTAFASLSRESQHRNRKVRDIAREFVHSVSTSAPPE